MLALRRFHGRGAREREQQRCAQAVNVRDLITDFRFGVLLQRPAAGENILNEVGAGTAHRLYVKARNDHFIVFCDAQCVRRDTEVLDVLRMNGAERVNDRVKELFALRPA